MKKFILISIISMFGILFYGCGSVYKTEVLYTTDSVTGKTIKKVIKYYDTTPSYNSTYVSPYPYYYANPYWYNWGGYYPYYGWGNNVYIIRPNQPRPNPQPRPMPRPMGPVGGHRGRF
jgi:hypothetical protein